MQSSARPPICPNCRGANVQGKSHHHFHHAGHGIGHLAGSHAVGLFATVALWLFGKAVDATAHQWKCESCDHEFSPAPGSCGRCTATSDTMPETSCCHVRLCEACAADYENAASSGCLLCGYRDQSRYQAQEDERAQPRQATPNQAALYGFLTAFGLILIGAGLGYAGGNGWFLTEAIAHSRQAAIDKGEDRSNPGAYAVGAFLAGRLDRHPVQTAAQDAALPLFPIAFVVCICYFGMGWTQKAFVGAIVFVVACCAIRVLVWLFTWPATLVIDRLPGPELGALVLGVSFGLWGAVLGAFVWLLYRPQPGP
jgi:hypothetical protein